MRLLASTNLGRQRRRRSGFSLVEIVLALGLFSIAILAIIGLMGSAMQQTRDSEEKIQAANLSSVLLTIFKQNLQTQFKTGTAPAWPDLFPLPTSVSATSAGSFSDPPVAIDSQGRTCDNPDAVYALSYVLWEEPQVGTPTAPTRVVHCSLQLEWPGPAAVAGHGVQNSYVTTTSFLLTK